MNKLAVVLAVLISVGLAAEAAYCADAAAQAQESTTRVMPKKVQIDANYDGKVDRTESYDASGRPVRAEADNDGDGIMDEIIIYKDGKPVKSEKDTNKDGKPDVWIDL